MKVIIGLPSRNESKTIAKLVHQIDKTLIDIGLSLDVLLVNADCQSTDRTLEAFSSCNTLNPKTAISCGLGKGRAMLTIMKTALEEEADGILFIDTDLPEVPAEWLNIFLGLAYEGFDLVIPRRKPVWNGGDLTYQLCFPILAAIWGTEIQNPIAGEIFVSRKIFEACLAITWPESCLGYGVDFLIAQIGTQFKWVEAFLSVPKGNPLRSFHSDPEGIIRMGKKFFEVLESVVYFSRIRLSKMPPIALQYSKIGYPTWSYDKVERNNELESLALSTQRDLKGVELLNSLLGQNLINSLNQIFDANEQYRGISWQLWEECLVKIIRNYDSEKLSEQEKQMLENLFLCRVVGHYFEILGTTLWYETIENQAASLFKKRLIFWNG